MVCIFKSNATSFGLPGTLPTIFDEMGITKEHHSKEPAVDRLVRHAWQPQCTGLTMTNITPLIFWMRVLNTKAWRFLLHCVTLTVPGAVDEEPAKHQHHGVIVSHQYVDETQICHKGSVPTLESLHQ